jgi:hypothetical protein
MWVLFAVAAIILAALLAEFGIWAVAVLSLAACPAIVWLGVRGARKRLTLA